LSASVSDRAERANQTLQIRAGLLENCRREPPRLSEKVEQQMLRIHLRISSIRSILLGRNQGLARLRRESVESHFSSS
jgi:hypothetical protein